MREITLFPDYTRGERIADGCVHLAGIIFSVAATAVLMIASVGTLPALNVASLGIYGFGLVGMFVSSASYNLVTRHAWKKVLRRVDHTAIFVMIAGSYTPFALIKIGGSTGYWLLCAVWAVTILGIVVKLVFPCRFERALIALYLAQGWAILAAIDPLLSSISTRALTLLVIGGCLYTIGVFFHLWERLRFHNAIWHAHVLIAAACHFAAICDAMMPVQA